MEDAAFQDSLLFPSVLGWHALACASDRFPVLILSDALGGLNLGKNIFKYSQFKLCHPFFLVVVVCLFCFRT